MKELSKRLIEAIELLASNSDIQRKYLKNLGVFPCTDEIALEFDDAYHQFIGQAKWDLPNLITTELEKINSLLDSFSDLDDKTIWLEESLDNNLWGELRHIAISV